MKDTAAALRTLALSLGWEVRVLARTPALERLHLTRPEFSRPIVLEVAAEGPRRFDPAASHGGILARVVDGDPIPPHLRAALDPAALRGARRKRESRCAKAILEAEKAARVLLSRPRRGSRTAALRALDRARQQVRAAGSSLSADLEALWRGERC